MSRADVRAGAFRSKMSNQEVDDSVRQNMSPVPIGCAVCAFFWFVAAVVLAGLFAWSHTRPPTLLTDCVKIKLLSNKSLESPIGKFDRTGRQCVYPLRLPDECKPYYTNVDECAGTDEGPGSESQWAFENDKYECLLALHDTGCTPPDTVVVGPDSEFSADLDQSDDNLSPAASLPNGVDALDGQLNGVFESGGLDGNGTHLYVLDKGVACEHEAFAHALSCDGLFAGAGFIGAGDKGNVPLNNCQNVSNIREAARSHGTHVASTAAGLLVGVAPKVHIHSVMTIDCDGTGGNLLVLHKAVREVLNHKIQSIGMDRTAVAIASMGARIPDAKTLEAHNKYFDLMSDHGILVVAAAGNSGKDAVEYFPASASQVLTVGALTSMNDTGLPLQIADWSNYGEVVDIFATGSKVPGAVIASRNAYKAMSGTSFAAPLVAGVALQVLGKYPTASPALIREFILCISEKTAVMNGYRHESDANLPVARGGTLINSATACTRPLFPNT